MIHELTIDVDLPTVSEFDLQGWHFKYTFRKWRLEAEVERDIFHPKPLGHLYPRFVTVTITAVSPEDEEFSVSGNVISRDIKEGIMELTEELQAQLPKTVGFADLDSYWLCEIAFEKAN